jgi:hypothetical protein
MPGETPEQTAKRELQEETGLNPDALNIDWCSPKYVPGCKYKVYFGGLGTSWPQPSEELTSFSVAKANTLPENSTIRLRYAVEAARPWLEQCKATRTSLRECLERIQVSQSVRECLEPSKPLLSWRAPNAFALSSKGGSRMNGKVKDIEDELAEWRIRSI